MKKSLTSGPIDVIGADPVEKQFRLILNVAERGIDVLYP
jgi:hypothetical protein